ncbi:helix-turn-helix domain-containing protein [Streptomyces sp. CACIS-1.16CA]|uniref:helix-turn-helix domain-containing protein n=1 Tax=Streptomyces sp. CACIS-1.16CA TaxID=1175510 RepID=UPI0037D626C2
MTHTAERERTPNDVLTSLRKSMNLSQDEFAQGLRGAGEELGEPNDTSKRLVQRWESGETRTCRPLYARALKRFTGRAPESLGLIEPTGRRMAGKWVGFGKDFDVNSGPWELRLLDRSTERASIERYSASPE